MKKSVNSKKVRPISADEQLALDVLKVQAIRKQMHETLLRLRERDPVE